jgi:DNA repair protein SbcD/Mre11
VKILHTSDWHLGARIGRVDRADDAFARIAELTEVIDTEQVDLLLVAGDIFDETRTLPLGGLVRRLASQLAPRIADGLRAVFLAGNHDREPVFALLQAANDLFGPGTANQVMFVQRPELLQVPSRDGTEAVALACVPYPTHFRYDLETRGWPSRDARNRELADAVRTRIADLAEDAATRLAGLPMVMTGHLLIRNAKTGRGAYCLTEAEDVPIERGDLPAWDYIALGHIHKPQDMGHPSIRYSGSIERMDLGEADDTKSAVIVEVNERGSARHRIVPLNATPFASIHATSEADLLARRAELADPGRTLVSLTLVIDGTESVTGLVARAHELFPRLYREPEISRTITLGNGTSISGFDRSDVTGTVRSYLQQQLTGDPDAEQVLALADELLASDELALQLARDSEGAAP